MAMVAALYAVLFFGSAPGMLPGFTLLYLPVILLGVLPLWFGWSGLVGSMVGAFIGGVYVEGVAPYVAWVESVTALIIFGLNWLLIPRNTAGSKRSMVLLFAVYAVSLFLGTSYILWQYAYLFNIGVLAFNVIGDFAFGVVLVATFGLNYAIMLVSCPVLIKTVTPRLKSWGVYSGTFADWRSKRKKAA
ncbi:MAG: hypothetical protein NWE98_07280 [Candidatus Bathyarchaeota archaeon]|nr:hypothetical protein [Candidatus Bathyarchaeota archaeon]